MHIEEKFNKRSATLVECQLPVVKSGRLPAPHDVATRRVMVEFFPKANPSGLHDERSLSAFLTAAEALDLAEHLIATARRLIK